VFVENRKVRVAASKSYEGLGLKYSNRRSVIPIRIEEMNRRAFVWRN
jgi:hypothetical protein